MFKCLIPTKLKYHFGIGPVEVLSWQHVFKPGQVHPLKVLVTHRMRSEITAEVIRKHRELMFYNKILLLLPTEKSRPRRSLALISQVVKIKIS